MTPDRPQRRSIRLSGYDYRQKGAYFVTLCTDERRCVFGRIDKGIMRLNPYGRIAHDCWTELRDRFSHVVLDKFCIMPNHMHGILFLNPENPARFDAVHIPSNVDGGSLGAVVRTYKGVVQDDISAARGKLTSVWQRNYYERIIRDETELDAVRRYIIENPLHWQDDEHFRQAS